MQRTSRRRRWLLVALCLTLTVPALAQSPDLFESAPGPAGQPTTPPPASAQPEPLPPPQQPAVPTQSVAQQWEGTTGIWHMRAATLAGRISGSIDCFWRGRWLGGSQFGGTVSEAGTVAAETIPLINWADRRITGILPTLAIEAINPALDPLCGNGFVQLQRRS
jgi:hypothetical protein